MLRQLCAMQQISLAGGTMFTSVFHSKHKFLLDENVRKRVQTFLVSKGYDAIFAPKEFSDKKLASMSLSEKRVVVTNDADFEDAVLFPKEKIFSVILLRVPQNDPDGLISSLSSLLEKQQKFEGLLITLKLSDFEVSPLLQ